MDNLPEQYTRWLCDTLLKNGYTLPETTIIIQEVKRLYRQGLGEIVVEEYLGALK